MRHAVHRGTVDVCLLIDLGRAIGLGLDHAMPIQPAANTDELMERLAEAEHQTWTTERELRETLSSTSFRLGRTLVLAAKRPGKLLRLPAELWRLCRGRDQPTERADSMRTGPERLLAFYRSFPRQRGHPLIAVVGSRRTVRALGRSFDVVPMWPHDAELIAHAVTPDLVLLESGASMPGEAWSALGTPAEAGLGAHLAQVIQGLQNRAVPTVFWWTTPVDVTGDLSVLIKQSDWIAADTSVPGVPDAAPLSLGVDLGEVEPVRLAERDSDARPLIHLGGYEPDPRTGAANCLVEAAIAAGAQILRDPSHLGVRERTLGPDDLRLHYRRASWTTPTTRDLSHRCLAMLASGVPVLVQERPDDFRRIVEWVPPSMDIPAAVDAARQRIGTPEGMAEILRTLHQCGTTRQRFRRALEHFGIEVEPSGEDTIGVMVDVDSTTDGLVAAIAHQSVRPVEIVVPDHHARQRLDPDLQETGIPVRLIADAEATRHAVWSGRPWSPDYLHTMLVAAQISNTDRFLDEDGLVLTGSMGLDKALPWWIGEARVA